MRCFVASLERNSLLIFIQELLVLENLDKLITVSTYRDRICKIEMKRLFATTTYNILSMFNIIFIPTFLKNSNTCEYKQVTKEHYTIVLIIVNPCCY